MNIEQGKTFMPITIVLETAEEAAIFWGLIADCSLTVENRNAAAMRMQLASWFSNVAKL